jgi:hypothetical protein
MQQFYVIVPRNAAGTDDIKAVFVNRGDEDFSAQTSSLLPRASGVVRIRAALFATRIIEILLDELTEKAARSLRGEA